MKTEERFYEAEMKKARRAKRQAPEDIPWRRCYCCGATAERTLLSAAGGQYYCEACYRARTAMIQK